ncbi:MAG: tripartite tricarboxylate transporter permease [Anaerolineae bacterium]|nr:tripartite tricarboxylate transporter permease [Anaerolineae bacterium]
MTAPFSDLLLWTLLGTCAAAILALLPALHIYNVAGFLLLFGSALEPVLTPERLAFLFLGLITGYAMLNTIPSIFLSVPDESTLFIVLPGQKYLLQRRGYEAVVLSGLGGLGGVFFLALLAPVAARILPIVREILRPHLGWILWTVIAYLLLSEWPKGVDRAPAGWRRWWDAWRSLIAGLATFLLSALLGFILMYRPLVPLEVAYQNLLPAFVGLFAVPWVVQNLLARVELPPQHRARTLDLSPLVLLHGITAGVLGGMFAAFFPVVTGGIGGLLAGHATAQRDDRAFIISQGASKVAYYVGGLLLFFVPGLHLTRGGMAWMLSTRYSSFTPEAYFWATSVVLLAGTLSFFLLLALARVMMLLVSRVNYRVLSWCTLGILLLVVWAITGWGGMAICAVATGIGLIPALWGSRRMNCMGVLLLPIALNMVGLGDTVARLLGLL